MKHHTPDPGGARAPVRYQTEALRHAPSKGNSEQEDDAMLFEIAIASSQAMRPIPGIRWTSL